MKRVIITGGCGFIGSHVVENILKNYPTAEILVVDNLSKGKAYWSEKQVNINNTDIRHRNELTDVFTSYDPDTIFHLAAEHYIPTCENLPSLCYDVNVNGTLAVLAATEACANVKNFFFASTGDVYPPSHNQHKETEDTAPIYVYGESKYLCERLVQNFSRFSTFAPNVTIGRLFNAVGTRETNPHFLPSVLKQILDGVSLIEVGNTWPKRDFVDVVSMASVIIELTTKMRGICLVNIGSGQVQTIDDVLKLISLSFDNSVKFKSVLDRQRPNDRPILCPNVDHLYNLIGRACEPISRQTIENIKTCDPLQRFYF